MPSLIKMALVGAASFLGRSVTTPFVESYHTRDSRLSQINGSSSFSELPRSLSLDLASHFRESLVASSSDFSTASSRLAVHIEDKEAPFNKNTRGVIEKTDGKKILFKYENLFSYLLATEMLEWLFPQNVWPSMKLVQLDEESRASNLAFINETLGYQRPSINLGEKPECYVSVNLLHKEFGANGFRMKNLLKSMPSPELISDIVRDNAEYFMFLDVMGFFTDHLDYYYYYTEDGKAVVQSFDFQYWLKEGCINLNPNFRSRGEPDNMKQYATLGVLKSVYKKLTEGEDKVDRIFAKLSYQLYSNPRIRKKVFKDTMSLYRARLELVKAEIDHLERNGSDAATPVFQTHRKIEFAGRKDMDCYTPKKLLFGGMWRGDHLVYNFPEKYGAPSCNVSEVVCEDVSNNTQRLRLGELRALAKSSNKTTDTRKYYSQKYDSISCRT